MGFRNEGERDEKGIGSRVVEKRYKDTLIPIIKTLKKDARFIQIVGELTTHWTKDSNITQSIIVSTSRRMTVQAPRKSKGLVKLRVKSLRGVLHDNIKSILDQFTY